VVCVCVGYLFSEVHGRTLIKFGDRVIGKYLEACNNLCFSLHVIGVMKSRRKKERQGFAVN